MKRPIVRRLTTYGASIPAVYLAVIGTIYLCYLRQSLEGIIDAVIGGGALIYSQLIYREDEILRMEAEQKETPSSD